MRIQDLLDVLVVAGLLYAGITWLRRTKAAFVLFGVLIFGAFYVLARLLELHLTVRIFQGFVAVLLLALVVIFQEELRQIFERIARFSLRRDRACNTGDEVVDAIVSCFGVLARNRVGALLVIPGRDSIDRHVHGGIPLGARISEPLLRSLFDPHSPGHDGAVVVEGDRASRFAVHLPLSRDEEQLRGFGTRHSAALGLAERTDALCLVASEERGEVSVARDGRLVRLEQAQEARGAIERFLGETAPARTGDGGRLGTLLRENPAEKLLALALAAALWFAFVPGSQRTHASFSVPVTIENLPEELDLESQEPREVGLTVSGSRAAMYFVEPTDVRVRFDASLAALGRRTFHLSEANVSLPGGVQLESVDPDTVRISVRAKTSE